MSSLKKWPIVIKEIGDHGICYNFYITALKCNLQKLDHFSEQFSNHFPNDTENWKTVWKNYLHLHD